MLPTEQEFTRYDRTDEANEWKDTENEGKGKGNREVHPVLAPSKRPLKILPREAKFCPDLKLYCIFDFNKKNCDHQLC